VKSLLVIFASLAALIVMLLFGAGMVAGVGLRIVSDEPAIDCGDLRPDLCREAFERDTARFERKGRIAYYKIEPPFPDVACGDWTVSWYVTTIGPFGWTEADSAYVLCGP
jgi:hypothetical protein